MGSPQRKGLRRGELAGVKWDAVDFDSGSLRITRTRVLVDGAPVDSVPKTEAGRRTIPLDASLVASLRSHKTRQGQERWAAGDAWTERGYVFADELSAPLHPEYISTRFETLVQLAKLRRIRLHDTRHTAASLMLASGEDVVRVARLLGHSSPTITLEIYRHLMPGELEAAGERLSAALLG